MPTQSEIDAALTPLLWRGLAAGIALAACAVAAILRLPRGAPRHHPAPAAKRRGIAAGQGITVVLLTLLAAAFGATALRRPLGTDEATTFLFYASQPLKIGLTIYGSPNNHLLHTALVHLASRLFGDAEWALRLPAFLAGIALVPLTWIAARRLSPSGGGLFAAGLVAGAPVVLDYATDARGYTLFAACTLVAAAAMIDVMRNGSRAAAITFAIATALGFYAVPVMLYPFAAIAACGVLLGRERRATIRAIAAALCLAAAFYAPVISVSGIGAITANPYVRPLPWPAFFAALPRYVATVWDRMFAGMTIVLAVVVVAAALLRRRFRGAIAIAVAIIAVILLAQRVLPFPRVWLPLLPLLFLAASSWWRAPRIEMCAAIAIAILLGSGWLTNPRPRDTGELPGVVSIARCLRVRVQSGDAVIAATPSDLPLAFYLGKLAVPADVLHPDTGRARRLFVVCNYAAGMTLPRTLAALRIDPRPFAMRRIADEGAAAVFELDRRPQ